MTRDHIIVADDTVAWGSDVIARSLRDLGIEYVAFNPGASFRGLHDSLVNHLGAEAPRMMLCMHEEHAVAIAHGYAKVTERPMATILHSNVGLMHGAMAIFNAWCDRVPMLVLGATGPVDAAKRRPWIDWIHSSRDQAAIVRGFVKWDDQPASIDAACEALLRAYRIATTKPHAPTCVVLDAALQEQKLDQAPDSLETLRYTAPAAPTAVSSDLDRTAELLGTASKPVILVGRSSRRQEDWDRRVELAERVRAHVITDLKTGAAFPNAHPLHVGPAGLFLSAPAMARLRDADTVLSLDWVDLAGTLRAAGANPVQIINASPDELLARADHGDHQAVAPADIYMLADPDLVVAGLLERLPRVPVDKLMAVPSRLVHPTGDGPIRVSEVAISLALAVADHPSCLIRAPLSWTGNDWSIAHPLDYLGYDGGGGIGSGPGMAVGAALALKESGRLAVAVLGDGDTLMGITAFWTAAQHRLPLLIVVANNRSYFNDEIHQERVAIARNRPVGNKWIGQAIRDPDVDIAGMARAQGCTAFGPITNRDELKRVLREAVALANSGPVLVDVQVEGSYPPAMTAALSRG